MTNQAAQTMPANIVERLASAKDKLPAESDERMAVWRAIEYFRALSQPAGVAEDHVAIPRHYAENVGYAAAMLENSESVIDRHNAPALRNLVSLMLAAAQAASGVDTSTNEAWAARAQEKIAAMDAGASVSERDGGSPHCIGGGNWSPWDLFRLSTDMKLPVNLPAEKAMELRRDIERTLEQALTQQRDTTPQPSADAVRELVKRWLTDAPDDAHSTSMWDQGYAHGRNECADELESLLSAASGEKGADDRCRHENGSPGYDYWQCRDCGAFRTDSGWGVASHRYFNSRSEAEFYREHGRLPEHAGTQPLGNDHQQNAAQGGGEK